MASELHGHAHHHGHPHAHHGHAHHHGHPHDQASGHGHAHGESSRRVLKLALGLTAAFMVVEVWVGVVSGSLALLADAGHMLSDAGALGLAIVAQHWAGKPRTANATYGYQRAEVLAAFVNGIALSVVSVFVLKEAVERWVEPPKIDGGAVLGCATLGLIINGIVALLLRPAAGSNVNVRAALVHVLSDALGSIAAIGAALAVLFFGAYRADPVLSILIALLVAFGGWRILRHTASVLLESTPPEVDVKALETSILRCSGVASFHDLHAWRISEGFDAVTVHVTLQQGAHGVEVSREVSARIAADFGIHHVTVQPEAAAPAELVQLRQSRDGKKMLS